MAPNKGINGLKNSGRPLKNKYPAFLKPCLPGYSMVKLRIPSAYMRYTKGNVPSDALLKDCYGNIWPVKIGSIHDETYFLDGCLKFIEENNVKPGDFIMFHFDGYKTFKVTLLGRNSCQKKGLGHLISEIKEEEDDEEFEKPDDGNDTDCVLENNGSEFEGKRENNNVRSAVEEGVEDCPRKKRKKIDPFGIALFRNGGISYPRNEYFVTQVKSRRHILFIPKEIVDIYNLDPPEVVKLRDNAKGKEWESKLVKWKDSRVMYRGGWKQFCTLNLLGENDRCICEFVKSNDELLYIDLKVVRNCGCD